MIDRESTFAVALAIMTLASCGRGGGDLAVGDKAPDFRLESVGGETVSRRSLEGGPVIVTFWATWCQPCLKEIPILKTIEAESAARVVAISLDEGGLAAVKPFVQEHDLHYQVLIGDQEVFTRFGGIGIPYTVLLDGSGIVKTIYNGPIEREAIETDLASARGAF